MGYAPAYAEDAAHAAGRQSFIRYLVEILLDCISFSIFFSFYKKKSATQRTSESVKSMIVTADKVSCHIGTRTTHTCFSLDSIRHV